MAAIALRSPQYKSLTAGAASVYALCTIKIGGVLKYTLRKEAAPQQARRLWWIEHKILPQKKQKRAETLLNDSF